MATSLAVIVATVVIGWSQMKDLGEGELFVWSA